LPSAIIFEAEIHTVEPEHDRAANAAARIHPAEPDRTDKGTHRPGNENNQGGRNRGKYDQK